MVRVTEQLCCLRCSLLHKDHLFDVLCVPKQKHHRGVLVLFPNANFILVVLVSRSHSHILLLTCSTPPACMRQVCKDPSKRSSGKKGKRRLMRDPAAAEASGKIDYEKKILHMSWHPQDDIVAVAGHDKLYIYSAQ